MRGWLWPHIGWQRLGRYLLARLTRLSGTPHSIAAGFACGVALSFTPFVGFHLVGAIGLAFLVRGNYLAAAAGTFVGNPWTFPFIWLAAYKLGQLLLGNPASASVALFAHLSWSTLFEDLGALLWPMAIGGVPLGALAALAVYFPLVRVITFYQMARRRRREARRERVAKRAMRARESDPAARVAP